MADAQIKKTEIYKRRAMANTHPGAQTISLSAFDDENEIVAFTDLTVAKAEALQNQLQSAIQEATVNLIATAYGESSANFLRRLKSVTRDCRADMHEPDEQGLSCYVTGDHLDNANGNLPGSGEYVVTLENAEGNEQHFNLAVMIAILKNYGGAS